MILLASSESSRDITFAQSIKAQERPNLNSKSTFKIFISYTYQCEDFFTFLFTQFTLRKQSF